MGNIFFNEEKSLDYFDKLGKVSNKMNEATGDLFRGTKAIIDNGDANVVAGEMAKYSESIEGLMGDSSKYGKEFVSNLFAEERSEANLIAGVMIPKDFVAEDASEINYYNSVLLSKIDGKSVNEGQTTKKVNDIDESSVVKEALTDINNNVTENQVYDASSTITGQSVLENINGNKTEEKTYDDTSRVSNQQLSNISGNTTQGQMYNDMSTIVGQSILGNINAEKETAKQELNEENIISAVLNEKRENEEREQK